MDLTLINYFIVRYGYGMGLYFQKSSGRNIYWGVNIYGDKSKRSEVFFIIHMYAQKVLEGIIYPDSFFLIF